MCRDADATTVTAKSGGGTSYGGYLKEGAVITGRPTSARTEQDHPERPTGGPPDCDPRRTTIRALTVIVDDAPEQQWQVRFGLAGGLLMAVVGLGFLFSAARSMSKGR